MGRKGNICPPHSFCKDYKTLNNTKNIFFGGGERSSVIQGVSVVASGTVSDCPNTGHFCIVAGCTHIVTLLSRNGEPSRRWEDNIEMDLQEVGCGGGMDWINLAQHRDRWRTLANAVMNIRVP